MEYRIMSDKKVSNNKLSAHSGTEQQETAKISSDSNTNQTKSEQKKSSNKTATIALVLATISVFTSLGHYTWQQQQTSAQFLALSQENSQALQQSQAQLKSSLSAEFNQQLQQQHSANSQSQQSAQQVHIEHDTQVQRLAAQISQLAQQVTQRQPSDWLIHEAEYLVRVAARTMWLERDTKAAIGLLRDADNRLEELNQPKFLPVRALINEDIESLALMPTLNNQQAILTLMALNKQVATLTLASVNLTAVVDASKEDLALSDDIGDWQENLAKTWQKFLNDFITVRRRTGQVEPLMTPEQQQHLKQNISLKVQLVQWAASEQKEEVYQQTLLDIQQWLNEFFDMSLPVNQKFYQAIEQLKQQTIYYDYPSDLRSLTAIKRLLDDTKQITRPQSPKLKNAPLEQKSTPSVGQTPTPEANKPVDNEPASGGQL
ncbi:heme biosynthesis operon protein HemX [Colwellia sp. MT41]|nr:heme biosynthesis operon protein HemX [Colwellia sp. MT41]